ncbi:hypothetical protein [Qipengyuania nanhaisediminis]|uniref:hypothetical protein n=1 Tax=Qipengyuania nanhaisediminis TaxID=604088 RepID=UPI0038B3C5C9
MSYEKNNEVHIEDEEARGAESSGVMRYVLGISVLLAIIAMSVAWMTGALTQGEVESAATVTGTEEAVEAVEANDADEDTDGVVGLEEEAE